MANLKKNETSVDKTLNQNDIIKFLLKESNKGKDIPIAFKLNEENPTNVKYFISTGCTALDYIISNRRNGGVPGGKLTEILGLEASGKSLISTHILANTQKKENGIGIYIDTENAANPDFMKRVGLDLNKLVYLQPRTIEECYESIEKTMIMARTKSATSPVTIVWDSTAATPPKAEVEGDYDPNSRIGLAAKAHAKGLRKLTQTVGWDSVTLVFTNQLKMNVGVLYGDKYVSPGGKAVPYHASVRIRLAKKSSIEENGEVVGFETTAKVIKTRLGPPSRTCNFPIMFSAGIDDFASMRDMLWDKYKLIKKAGGWWIIDCGPDGKEIKFRGKDFSKMLKKDEKLKNFILDKMEEKMIVKYED